jgi:uridine kinase
LSQDSFYKTLDAEGSRQAFLNEYDFDSPDAIDFDVLVDRLRDLKAGYFLPLLPQEASLQGVSG